MHRGMVVTAASYAAGTLMLAQAPNEAGRSSLLVASRDCTVPPVGTAIGASVGAEALRETSGPMDLAIPGGTVGPLLLRLIQETLLWRSQRMRVHDPSHNS